MPKVSIIIPIYNVEKYLNQCLDSIINQTLNDIEIILVNDGSKDNSGQICEAYAQKDNRIKIIHKKNEGPSIARNIAIELAHGEYIGFVDSDDFVDLNFFEELYNNAKTHNASISTGNIKKYIENVGTKEIDNLFERNFYFGFWRNIYKNDLIKKYKIKFPEKIFCGEDIYFLYVIALYFGQNIVKTDVNYFYRINKKSLSFTLNKNEKCFDIFKIFELCQKELNNAPKDVDKVKYQAILDKLCIEHNAGHLFSITPRFFKNFLMQTQNQLKKIKIKSNPYLSKKLKTRYKIIMSSKYYIPFKIKYCTHWIYMKIFKKLGE